ncbi:MAG: hypothetical protein HUJ65_04510, partial [Oscillospiraceae bacterium]|nr:hypothetical protein [Oscillospiraceae bacterium]
MKKLIAILLAVVIVLSLTACGGSTGDKGGNDQKTYNLIVTNHDAVTSVGEQYVETLFNQISEASGGRLTFTFNAGGSLASGPESVEAV